MKTKIKLAVDEAEKVLKRSDVSDTEAREIIGMLAEASHEASPWWVIVLKTLAYLIGLLLAGYGTSAVAQTWLL